MFNCGMANPILNLDLNPDLISKPSQNFPITQNLTPQALTKPKTHWWFKDKEVGLDFTIQAQSTELHALSPLAEATRPVATLSDD